MKLIVTLSFKAIGNDVLKIDNIHARRLWLSANGLAASPTGLLDTLQLIKNLGFVQLDTIQVVARAHHHILWSRNQNYREPFLNKLMSEERSVFEHFTHDASVLPMDFLPMWQRQFGRMKVKVEKPSWFGNSIDEELLEDVRKRIKVEGPLSTHDFTTKIEGEREMWKRPPHKTALDYLWYSGELATSHRVGIIKFYDLAERVYPASVKPLTNSEQIDRLCVAALERIGIGTLSDIRKFWDATTVAEVADWAKRKSNELITCEVQSADGSWTKAFAHPSIETRTQTLKKPALRMRILNPFDPAIRDRARLKRLFGFDYTVEMFVPEAKRKWGYYVYPLLLGDQFVGRIELKADRPNSALNVLKIWCEYDKGFSKSHMDLLKAELARFTRFSMA